MAAMGVVLVAIRHSSLMRLSVCLSVYAPHIFTHTQPKWSISHPAASNTPQLAIAIPL